MKTLALIISSAFLLAAALKYSYNAGYNNGWEKGADDLFSATIDTVTQIMDKQLKSDTSVTKLILINRDTTTYCISRKTVLHK